MANIVTDHFSQKFYTAGVSFTETFTLSGSGSNRVRIVNITSGNPATVSINVSFNSGWGNSVDFTISGEYDISVFTSNVIWHMPRGIGADDRIDDPRIEKGDTNLAVIDNETRKVIRFDPQLSPEYVDWTIEYLENTTDDDNDDSNLLSLTDQTVYNNFNTIRTQFSAYV